MGGKRPVPRRPQASSGTTSTAGASTSAASNTAQSSSSNTPTKPLKRKQERREAKRERKEMRNAQIEEHFAKMYEEYHQRREEEERCSRGRSAHDQQVQALVEAMQQYNETRSREQQEAIHQQQEAQASDETAETAAPSAPPVSNFGMEFLYKQMMQMAMEELKRRGARYTTEAFIFSILWSLGRIPWWTIMWMLLPIGIGLWEGCKTLLLQKSVFGAWTIGVTCFHSNVMLAAGLLEYIMYPFLLFAPVLCALEHFEPISIPLLAISFLLLIFGLTFRRDELFAPLKAYALCVAVFWVAVGGVGLVHGSIYAILPEQAETLLAALRMDSLLYLLAIAANFFAIDLFGNYASTWIVGRGSPSAGGVNPSVGMGAPGASGGSPGESGVPESGGERVTEVKQE